MVPGLCSSLRCYIHFFFFFFLLSSSSSAELGVESWAYWTLGKHWATFPSLFHGHLLIFFCPYLVVYCLHLGQPHKASIISWLTVCGNACVQGAHQPGLSCTEGCLTSAQGYLPSHQQNLIHRQSQLSKTFTKAFWLLPESAVTREVEEQSVRRMVHSQVGGKMCEPSCPLPKLDIFFIKLFILFLRI